MAAPSPAPLNFKNVQGDILAGGLPKKTQTFFFFRIDQARVKDFRTQLTHLIPLITTTDQVVNDRGKIDETKRSGHDKLLKLSGVNISFTHKGLGKIGINDKTGDDAFDVGMLAGAEELGDKGTGTGDKFVPDWDNEFKQEIDGLIMVTGEGHSTVHEKLEEIKKIFSVGGLHASIHKVKHIVGDVRPGKEKGHEHFGFLDGISQPAVKDVDTKPFPGQETVRQGIILLGRDGDALISSRPSWALDGSLLAFRYLHQLVPEFNEFLKNPVPGLPNPEASELLGARLVGRWKSGTPVDLAPLKDDPDPKFGADPQRNNNFSYTIDDDQQNQARCPFAAHIRKTNPRADLESLTFSTENRRLIRSGIPFGPEVSPKESAAGKTSAERGLLFVAYQSSIVNGFQFMQQSWANTPGFPIRKPVEPGIDPIIGQLKDNAGPRSMSGADPTNQTNPLSLPINWVVPKGGEYFFTPSIPALKDTFALPASEGHKEL